MKEIKQKESKLKTIFKNARIVALAGDKNSGKTNNLIHLIQDYRETNKDTPIYVYGMQGSLMPMLKKLNVKEISSLKHLSKKQNAILIIDEFQRLKLNDRRYKDELDEFKDFVYHNNVYAILSTPSIREFNSIIGGIVEKWLLKDVSEDMCVNGSQLKRVISRYNGRYKSLGDISIPVDKLLLINDEEEIIIDCPYVEEADTKKDNVELF